MRSLPTPSTPFTFEFSLPEHPAQVGNHSAQIQIPWLHHLLAAE
jgi:hypothetical protein